MDRRIEKTVDGDVTGYVCDTSMENPLSHDDIVLVFEAGTALFLERRWAHSTAVNEPIGYEQNLSTFDPSAGVEGQSPRLQNPRLAVIAKNADRSD